MTQKAYVAECRGGPAAVPTAAPAPAPAPAAPAPKPTVTAPAPAPAQAPVARAPSNGTPSGAGQFATEAQAKANCPVDTVVWVNLRSKIYHFSGTRNYGTTKNGAYMCERDTAAQGMRAAKNEQHP
ncbi:MAG: signal protein [Bradyrhizobium sp.]|nr:MAG: signal protein [Bradyrhizobium sp.]